MKNTNAASSPLLLVIGLLLLLATEILRVYFIMPFPGSQQADTIAWAYQIEKYKWLLRLIGFALMVFPARRVFAAKKVFPKVLLSVILVVYAVVFFFFNFRFEADKMFYQPGYKTFSGISENRIDSNGLVIGVDLNGQARAYPIQVIGYHHQVRDTVGGTQVMVTYCTVCRTGRVYSPIVNGHSEIFRLVGMDHFNAMFEDETTKSWWRQATGVAIAGPLKNSQLKEIVSHQYSLASWFRIHPHATVFQGDSNHKKDYADLAGFDKGTIKGHLEKRDSASWKMKSWVVGVKSGELSKTYDWNELVRERFIQDNIGKMPMMLVLASDTSSFYAISRALRGQTLSFYFDRSGQSLSDSNTHSVWNLEGTCISGPLEDAQLSRLDAYQEFLHSWETFHSNAVRYKP